jgi:hypothetical protein
MAMRALVAVSFVLICIWSSVAGARPSDSPFFPLIQGWRWTFVGDGGDSAVAWVDGIRQVQGQETIVRHWQFFGEYDEYLEQYYTVDQMGNVLMHGLWSGDAGLSYSFRPPILYLPSSLGAGSEWCTNVQDYSDLEGTKPVGEPHDVCFRVYSIDQIELPSGMVTAFGIGSYLPDSLRWRSSVLQRSSVCPRSSGRGIFSWLDGRPIDFDATNWYTAGIGEVAFRAYQRFGLVSWTEPPTPVRRTTWGAIKSAFLPA